MKTNLKAILFNRYTAFGAVVFVGIMIAAPERGPTEGLAGRIFMSAWCASGLMFAAILLFNLPAARIVLDAVFTLQGRFMLFGEARDAYAMSNFAVRMVGVGMLAITSLGFYDIFFR